MGYPIFHSQYTAAQIEASIGKTPRIKAATRTWEVWDIATSAYVDTGVSIDTELFVDSTLTESGYAADAKITGTRLGELRSRIDNAGLMDTDAAKDALLACFANVAWIGNDGQDYYDALYNALYSSSDVVSISAVYTQSGTVYSTDSLNSLKNDLVVTATYSDSSTWVVTTYTLSGTLTDGTSTITVRYGGKTTTFNVIVTGTVKLTNGTHTFSDNSFVTVNNNHVTIYLATRSTGNHRFVNLSDLGGNTANIFSNTNVNNKTTTLFSLSANDTATLNVFNASSDNATWPSGTTYYDIALSARKYNDTTSVFPSAVSLYPANSTPGHEKITEGSTSYTASTSITASCLFVYIAASYPAGTTIEFDVELFA